MKLENRIPDSNNVMSKLFLFVPKLTGKVI